MKIVFVGTLSFAAIVGSVMAQPLLNSLLAGKVVTSSISELLLALGTALIGVTGLAFTLVMFAMQVNVERLPHGLFRKFSTDSRLLVYFGLSIVLALGMTILSLAGNLLSAATSLLFVFWFVVAMTALLWSAYRRALLLINPSAQLKLMVASIDSDMQRYVRRAKLLELLLPTRVESNDDPLSLFGPKPEFDAARGGIFHLYPNWSAEAHRGISYAVSIANRFAEIGDYETSRAALIAIVHINQRYIVAKGRTFIESAPFAALTGIASGGDSIITDTLEHLRQYMQVALARKDERQIEQVLAAFAALTQVYLQIQYAVAGGSKHYPALAAGYLTAAVKTTTQLKSPDVLMEGVRQIGQVGRLLLAHGMKLHVATVSEDLYSIALDCLPDSNLRMVIRNIMEEFSKTLKHLLLSDAFDIKYQLDQLQDRVTATATLLLRLPERRLHSQQSMYVAPFYSCANALALPASLTQLTNMILSDKADDSHAARTIQNIADWAEDLWKPHRELLQVAVQKKSQMALDLIQWISQISKMLLILATTNGINPGVAERLRKAASWLVMTLSWIPQDKDSIALAESYQLTEHLFDVARTAQERQAPKIVEQLQELMLDRACSATSELSGWASLIETIQGLCVLAVTSDSNGAVEALVERLRKSLASSKAPSQSHRTQVANQIFDFGHGMSHIEYAMRQVDRQALHAVLKACAAVLRGES